MLKITEVSTLSPLIFNINTNNVNELIDDLVGEAVIPVQDLCSSLNAKRVIQLHRFGQTKTGSITAEVYFIKK